MEVTKQREKVYEIHIQGKIHKEDYDFIPKLEEEIEKHGKINLYCVVENIDGIEPGAVWKDLKFGINHFNSFERVAIVGDQKWVEWMSAMAKPFTTASVKIFNPEEKEKANEWVTPSWK